MRDWTGDRRREETDMSMMEEGVRSAERLIFGWSEVGCGGLWKGDDAGLLMTMEILAWN